MPPTPRAQTLATEQYLRARRQYMQRSPSSADTASITLPTSGYSYPTLTRGPHHSLRKVAHQMYVPFQAYGVEPLPKLAQTVQSLREHVPTLFGVNRMEQELQQWMSQKGISLRSKLAARAPRGPDHPIRRCRSVPPLPSCDVLGDQGKRQLVNCPVPATDYLERQYEKDSHFLPPSMMGQMKHQNCLRRQFLSVKVQVAEEFDLMKDPLEADTKLLSRLSGISKLQIEEMRRRWYREAPLGLNDLHAVLRLTKQCGVEFVCHGTDPIWSILSDMFDFLDVKLVQRLEFAEFVRMIGVLVMAQEPLDQSLLKSYSHMQKSDHKAPPAGDRMSRRDLLRVNMKMQLAKVFYGNMSLDKKQKRVCAVQVNRMMRMLKVPPARRELELQK